MITDPTLTACFARFGESAELARTPVVVISAVLSLPGGLVSFGGVEVDTGDAMLTVLKPDVQTLGLSPGDVWTVRDTTYRAVTDPIPDDGDGMRILLRKVPA